MSNINEILTSGSGLSLDSVEITRDFGLKSGKTTHRALLVKDASGDTMIKLWGNSANVEHPVGTLITVRAVGAKGRIESSEWQGKFSLNCNDCEVSVANAAQPAPQQPAPQQAAVQQQATSTSSLTPDQLADAQVAHFGRVIKRLQPLADEGIMDAEKLPEVAASMVGTAAQWFFGEKYPGHRN